MSIYPCDSYLLKVQIHEVAAEASDGLYRNIVQGKDVEVGHYPNKGKL